MMTKSDITYPNGRAHARHIRWRRRRRGENNVYVLYVHMKSSRCACAALCCVLVKLLLVYLVCFEMCKEEKKKECFSNNFDFYLS